MKSMNYRMQITLAAVCLFGCDHFALAGEVSLGSFTMDKGFWSTGKDGAKNVLIVDGQKWWEQKSKETPIPTHAADEAGMYDYFPIAVAKQPENFKNGSIHLSFRPVSGRIDQAAGIVFDLKENGDYMLVRSNSVERNLVLFQYKHGKRKSLKRAIDLSIPSGEWHRLTVDITGQQVKGTLDGKATIESLGV